MSKRKHILSPKRKGAAASARIQRVAERGRKTGDLKTWQRAKAVAEYVEGRSAATIAGELHVDRSAVFKWTAAYAQRGVPALQPSKAPGARARLTEEEMSELTGVI